MTGDTSAWLYTDGNLVAEKRKLKIFKREELIDGERYERRKKKMEKIESTFSLTLYRKKRYEKKRGG